MKKCGTRIWGWEMPWWNWSVGEVRAAGAAFGKAGLTMLDENRTGSASTPQENPLVEVPHWGLHEVTARGHTAVESPFRKASLLLKDMVLINAPIQWPSKRIGCRRLPGNGLRQQAPARAAGAALPSTSP
jgi:hypothetical protein